MGRTDLCFLKIKCPHAIQRKGGFSPPLSVIQAVGRGKPAPTMMGALFIQRPLVCPAPGCSDLKRQLEAVLNLASDVAGALADDFAEIFVAEIQDRIIPVDLVERVVGLDPHLELEALAQLERLAQSHVGLRRARPLILKDHKPTAKYPPPLRGEETRDIVARRN